MSLDHIPNKKHSQNFLGLSIPLNFHSWALFMVKKFNIINFF